MKITLLDKHKERINYDDKEVLIFYFLGARSRDRMEKAKIKSSNAKTLQSFRLDMESRNNKKNEKKKREKKTSLSLVEGKYED